MIDTPRRATDNPGMTQQLSRPGAVLAAVLVSGVLAGPSAAFAQSADRPDGNGVFVQDGDRYVELTVWGRKAGQQFALGEGRVEDIPVVTDFGGVFVRMGTMRLGSAFVGTADSFQDRLNEWRAVRIFSRDVGARASSIRIADLERPEKVVDLMRQVGATGGNEGYVFLAVGDMGPDRRGVERASPAGPELDMATAGRPATRERIYLFRLASGPAHQ